jgi:ribosomal protein S12 methylthiotransferase accessory factor
MLEFEQRYKEITPQQTIQNIKNILAENKIKVEEIWWQNTDEKLVPKSVSIMLTDTSFSTNGKGINADFALASAYGEFMERIQNISMPCQKFKVGINEKYYLTTPDNKALNEELWLKCQKLGITEQSLDSFTFEESKNHFTNLQAFKYYHVNSGQVEYLPELLLFDTGSNGMCAGNSMPEALIEGICEIFERVVLKKLYYDDVNLPEIPESFLKGLSLWPYFEHLKSLGYDISIRDCSLNGKYPVVGLIIRSGNRFRLNLGSAPDFEIALERCLTETLQGKSIADLKRWLVNTEQQIPADQSAQSYWDKQLWKSMTTGSGNVKPELFNVTKISENPAFSFRGKNNRETLQNLFNIILHENGNIFIRDVSFLGFPAFHIYVPKLSETKKANLQIKPAIARANDILQHLGNATITDIKFLLNTICKLRNDKSLFLDDDSDIEILSNLLKVPKVKEIICKINLNMIIAVLSCYVNDYANAMVAIDNEINKTESNLSNQLLSSLRLVIDKLSHGQALDEIKSSLVAQVPIVQMVINFLEDHYLFSAYLNNLKIDYLNKGIGPFCLNLQQCINRYSFDQQVLKDYFSNYEFDSQA